MEFRGHPLVSSLHPTTIEVTTEDHLTSRGDCIIGVSATSGCSQLPDEVKSRIRRQGARLRLTISVGSESFVVTALGGPELSLSHPRDIVIRKSGFVSDRTLAVKASAASRNIPRSIVSALRAPGSSGSLMIEVL